MTVTFLAGLEREARVSSHHEAYHELVRMAGLRLGMTAVLGRTDRLTLTVEVLVNRSARATAIERVLSRRGYVSMHLDNGWVAHEREVPRGRVTAEWRFLRGLIEGGDRGASR